MKKIIFQIAIVLTILAVGLPLMAEETGQINYQARLLDSYGRRLNTTVDLSFKIYDAATDGNLLWSETQTDVVVQDGVYSVVLGSQTPIPASVFAQDNVYLELGINSETMTPRQPITASAHALVARTIMGSNVYENQTSGYVGIGTTNPAVKLDVSGTIKATGFKMPTGATAGYVLASDGDGVGTWQSVSIVVTEHDPIFTNWASVVYTPATNSIWAAIGAEATTRANADTTLQNNVDAEATTRANADTALQNNIDASSNALSTAVGLRMFRSGDVMTGPLTNNVLIAGNGAGLTNVPASGLILTNYVQRNGDTMSGTLIISNNLTIALTNGAGTTNYISLGGVAISNWNEVTGGDLTNSLAQLQNATNILNASTATLNTAVGHLQDDVGVVSNQVDLHTGQIGAISNDTDKLQADVGVVSNKVDLHTGQIGAISNDLDAAEGNITKLQADVGVVSNKVDLHTGQIGAISNDLDTLQADVAVVSNQADTARAIANGLNTRSNYWDNAVVNRTGTAGDAIAFSNIYYFGVNGSWSNANAANSATAQGMLGIALGDANAGDPVPGSGLLLNGQCTNAWGFDPGTILYLATNTSQGQITATRPTGTNHIVRIVGYAINATTIFFNPDRTYVEIVGE